MAETRVALVADTHLGPIVPEADANWDAVVDHVAAEPYDLVIHLGDLSLDGASRADDLVHSRRLLDRVGPPWFAIPGNHDVGDNPWPGRPDDERVDDDRRDRWIDVVGDDFWSIDVAGWRIVGIDAQLLTSGLPAEREQEEWLTSVVAGADGRRLALMSHKPWLSPEPDPPPDRFVPAEWIGRLGRTGMRTPDLIASGHVHQHRVLRHDDTDHLWAPTTWSVLPESIQPTLGTKTCGLVALVLRDDGSSTSELVVPEEMRQIRAMVDIPNPYAC